MCVWVGGLRVGGGWGGLKVGEEGRMGAKLGRPACSVSPSVRHTPRDSSRQHSASFETNVRLFTRVYR